MMLGMLGVSLVGHNLQHSLTIQNVQHVGIKVGSQGFFDWGFLTLSSWRLGSGYENAINGM